jgi:DNA-directed RNA polymerase specialized sigma54-like protein
MPKAASRAKKSPAQSRENASIAKLKQKIAVLEAENTELKSELEQYIEKWETLDGAAVKALMYLSRHKTALPKEVAKGSGVHLNIAESYLRFLSDNHYVRAPAASGKPYTILHKGIRYLQERGLLD